MIRLPKKDTRETSTLFGGTSAFKGLPCWLSWKIIRPQCGRPGFNPWVGKIPQRRESLLTPVFWPAEFHGQSMGIAKSWTRLSSFHFHLSKRSENIFKVKTYKGLHQNIHRSFIHNNLLNDILQQCKLFSLPCVTYKQYYNTNKGILKMIYFHILLENVRLPFFNLCNWGLT